MGALYATADKGCKGIFREIAPGSSGDPKEVRTGRTGSAAQAECSDFRFPAFAVRRVADRQRGHHIIIGQVVRNLESEGISCSVGWMSPADGVAFTALEPD
jgi:hypothetical protein